MNIYSSDNASFALSKSSFEANLYFPFSLYSLSLQVGAYNMIFLSNGSPSFSLYSLILAGELSLIKISFLGYPICKIGRSLNAKHDLKISVENLFCDTR